MKLRIRHWPDPILSAPTASVDNINEALRSEVAEMFRLMYENRGIGLAGPQAGLSKRIVVMNLSGDPQQTEAEQVFINPVIKSQDGPQVWMEEGCLSFPDIKGSVERSERCQVEAYDLEGQLLSIEADGLLARCFLHEVDHLDGLFFVDQLSPGDRLRVEPQLKALKAQFKAPPS